LRAARSAWSVGRVPVLCGFDRIPTFTMRELSG
jgi:hypothetical protein